MTPTVTRIRATFADDTTSVLLGVGTTETVGLVKTEVRKKLADRLKENYGLHPAVLHPDDDAIQIETCTSSSYSILHLLTNLIYKAGETTIKRPFPDSTLISDLIKEDDDFLTAVLPGPSIYPFAKGPLVMISPSKPQLNAISNLHRMMTNFAAATEQLKVDAAASERRLEETEQKLKETEERLRAEAAASEQRLKNEAAELRVEADELRDQVTDTEQRLSNDICALKDELDKEKEEHKQNLDYIRDVRFIVIVRHILRSLYVFLSAYSTAHATSPPCIT